ncbi:pyrroline-5-carboxylate reductase [Rhodovulum iodosum]|uniref:Pyrroline-5-carboxylate reductase n=1 Tax=Rhodovulum iodosum TaxID=68291 RepID=A0ABV3XY82_9RHOB|nr:pyrroline-5-carboxylate reductase dimerization domain-containing protein [Rhodovulum robiginosum]RSK33511.1 pyrroline-5-carboxylate reductase [Rhodovulum robiginosum]
MARIGIVGGNGALGSAIGAALLAAGVPEGPLWIASRSGTAGPLAGRAVRVTEDAQELAEACDVILLSVPPAEAGRIGVAAPDRLVISVMAGVTHRRLAALTGAARVVRAMSSPAAARGLAYSVWFGGGTLTGADRALVGGLFAACGESDELAEERQIDLFTAMTGPVPGFVAYFADCMQGYATERGVPAPIAERAVRQLFLAAGQSLAGDPEGPAAQVQAMVDYAGSTAAGLTVLRAGPLAAALAEGLDAAAERARALGQASDVST